MMSNLASFYYDLTSLSMPMCLKMAKDMDKKLGVDMMRKVYVDNSMKLFGL